VDKPSTCRPSVFGRIADDFRDTVCRIAKIQPNRGTSVLATNRPRQMRNGRKAAVQARHQEVKSKDAERIKREEKQSEAAIRRVENYINLRRIPPGR